MIPFNTVLSMRSANELSILLAAVPLMLHHDTYKHHFAVKCEQDSVDLYVSEFYRCACICGVENEHYSTLSGLIRLVVSLECFMKITPYFLCPFMND